MKQEIYPIIIDGLHEYTIEVIETDESTAYTMRHADNDYKVNRIRNEHLITVIDHGNGVNFHEKIPRNQDYMKFSEYVILIDFINRRGNICAPWKTTKVIN